jgi:glycosyltransferase involved in cell wall biosynthesis
VHIRTSVYVPCYNAASTLGACLESLCRQTGSVGEIVVVDDGSTDESARVAKRFPVTVLTHDGNRGLSAARNTAVQYLRTEFIASLDADCVAASDWLALLEEAMSDPSLAGAGGMVAESGGRGVCDRWRAAHMPQHWGNDPCRPKFLFGANTLFRRSALLAAGLYDERYTRNYEDVDISHRLLRAGRELYYEPRARVEHLRRDSLHSLLSTYWDWHRVFYQEQGFYRDDSFLVEKVKDSFGLANRVFEEDLRQGRRELCYIDFLLGMHHVLEDLQHFHRFPEGAYVRGRGDAQLALWVSCFDLVYNSAGGRRTFVTAGDMCAQNAAAALLAGLQDIRRVFSREDDLRRFCEHLIFALYGVIMPRLASRLVREACSRDWAAVISRPHLRLHQVFLLQVTDSLRRWIDQRAGEVPLIEAISQQGGLYGD